MKLLSLNGFDGCADNFPYAQCQQVHHTVGERSASTRLITSRQFENIDAIPDLCICFFRWAEGRKDHGAVLANGQSANVRVFGAVHGHDYSASARTRKHR